MKAIRTLSEANAALQPYVPLVAQLTGGDLTLERVLPLLAAVGNPQDQIHIIHIAGTSGKTSTAYFMAALLRQAGKTVGLTVSPHIDSVAERVQINGRPLAEQEFCALLSEFLPVVERLADKPSYFELLYAFSFYVFAKKRVDYAVVETGMGGLHDATNAAQKPDKVCIITDIGYDHMHILGDTLEKIAAQKAGIIHEGNQVFMYGQDEAVMRSLRSRVSAKQATLTVVSQDEIMHPVADTGLAALPDFQQRNWLLALAAYNYVAGRDELPPLGKTQLQASQAVTVPARMEVLTYEEKTVVMDGAHNVQKMAAFIESFQHRYPGVRPAVLLALKQSKESVGLGALLSGFASSVIVTSFNTSQDLPAVAIAPDELAASLRAEGVTNIAAQPDQHVAWLQLLSQPGTIYVVTGSFYLLSQLRAQEKLI